MNWGKTLQVLVICLPVFAVIGLGKVLALRGWLSAETRNAINRIIYYLALPALILNAVARQRFSEFLNPALILPGFAAILVLTAGFALLARLLGHRRGLAAAFVFGTFWANVTYMGFPLATNAFGESGLALAAVYNAFLMPAFIVAGFVLLGIYDRKDGDTWGDTVKQTFTNPILLAALIGIILAGSSEKFRDDTGALSLPWCLPALLTLSASFLRLIGAMGLPLALITIGASLHMGKLREYRSSLLLVLAGKLIGMPLLTLALTRAWFPEADPETVGVAVMLAAAPNAVASYVVAVKAGVDEGFVSSMLVLSTAISTLTIPIWLYCVI